MTTSESRRTSAGKQSQARFNRGGKGGAGTVRDSGSQVRKVVKGGPELKEYEDGRYARIWGRVWRTGWVILGTVTVIALAMVMIGI